MVICKIKLLSSYKGLCVNIVTLKYFATSHVVEKQLIIIYHFISLSKYKRNRAFFLISYEISKFNKESLQLNHRLKQLFLHSKNSPGENCRKPRFGGVRMFRFCRISDNIRVKVKHYYLWILPLISDGDPRFEFDLQERVKAMTNGNFWSLFKFIYYLEIMLKVNIMAILTLEKKYRKIPSFAKSRNLAFWSLQFQDFSRITLECISMNY